LNVITARQFQVNDLSWDRLNKLHGWEKAHKRLLTPAEINHFGRLKRHGEVPEEKFADIERTVMGMYTSIQDDIFELAKKSGEPYDEIDTIHNLDRDVKRRGLDFDIASGANQLVNRLKSKMASGDDF
jgi:hypothetical protein